MWDWKTKGMKTGVPGRKSWGPRVQAGPFAMCCAAAPMKRWGPLSHSLDLALSCDLLLSVECARSGVVTWPQQGL